MANEVVLNTIFQVKRATKGRWEELNPILRQGEPGYVIGAEGENLKIGDGTTPWKELKFVGSTSISVDDIPVAGEKDLGLIKATEDVKINENGEIISVSTNILTQGDEEIIFDCGGSGNNI